MGAMMRNTSRCGIVGAALIGGLLLGAGAAWAQSPMVDYETSAKADQVTAAAAWRLSFRPNLQVLQQTVLQLRARPGVTADQATQVDSLVAQAAGQAEADARRTYWRAVAVLQRRAWTPGEETVGALALRTPTSLWTGGGDKLSLATLYPPANPKPVTYRLGLYASLPTTSATPLRGDLVADLGTGRVEAGQAADLPAQLPQVQDGAYLLIAQVEAEEGARSEIVQPVYVVRDLDVRAAAMDAALAKITGHTEAKAIAAYPFALAKALRAGTREIVSYDFPGAIERSKTILAALESGRDPVRQAVGLQNRAYRFPETGELVPFQVYAPTTWTPGRKWPLMVALHGANLDETNMLGRDGARMQKLAEENGFVVVTPLGYRLNSAYGSERGFSKAIISPDQAERRRRSEVDVLEVLKIVEAEYNIDPARRYLTGNSMGGGGTWWIGGRHPELWAAIAPGAYGGVLPEDTAALGRLPIMVVVGDRDDLMLDSVRRTVATLKAGGVQPLYVEVPGGTHSSAFETTLPDIFAFFRKHAK